MKTCPQCDTEKPLDEFYNCNRRGRRRPGSWCKSCMKSQVIERQRKHKAIAVTMKGGACQSCGFDKYQGALEFHHMSPDGKSNDISRVHRNPETDANVRAELEKCILLCANCHRMTHAGLL